jgi:hypothetical protein
MVPPYLGEVDQTPQLPETSHSWSFSLTAQAGALVTSLVMVSPMAQSPYGEHWLGFRLRRREFILPLC